METLPEAEMSRYEADRAEAEIAFHVRHRVPPSLVGLMSERQTMAFEPLGTRWARMVTAATFTWRKRAKTVVDKIIAVADYANPLSIQAAYLSGSLQLPMNFGLNQPLLWPRVRAG